MVDKKFITVPNPDAIFCTHLLYAYADNFLFKYHMRTLRIFGGVVISIQLISLIIYFISIFNGGNKMIGLITNIVVWTLFFVLHIFLKMEDKKYKKLSSNLEQCYDEIMKVLGGGY